MANVVMRNEVIGSVMVARVIRQADLEAYLQMKTKLAQMQADFLASLKFGATVEAGRAKCYIEKGSERKPNWRKVLVEKCGQEAAKAALDATPPKPFERLRVEGPDEKDEEKEE